MPDSTSSPVVDFTLAQARARLSDRGIDPGASLGSGDAGEPISVADFYIMLGGIAASEKAGQNPTYAGARLALQAGLPSEVADTLFLAYNQQSAEEAAHGDKVFGNAYFAMGGVAATAEQSVFGGAGPVLAAVDDPRTNKQTLGMFAAAVGGIEVVALQRVFPLIVRLCEAWDHPIARDLALQIREQVRPEESRHVLLYRYVFHQLVASKGPKVIAAFLDASNLGRSTVAADRLDHESFIRLMGSSAPTPRQLLGKERAAFD